jgi:hypothetical protein
MIGGTIRRTLPLALTFAGARVHAGTRFSSVKKAHMSSALAANRLSTSTLLVPPTTDFFSSTFFSGTAAELVEGASVTSGVAEPELADGPP